MRKTIDQTPLTKFQDKEDKMEEEYFAIHRSLPTLKLIYLCFCTQKKLKPK